LFFYSFRNSALLYPIPLEIPPIDPDKKMGYFQ